MKCLICGEELEEQICPVSNQICKSLPDSLIYHHVNAIKKEPVHLKCHKEFHTGQTTYYSLSQKNYVIETLRENPKMDIRKIAEEIGVPAESIYQWISKWKDRGILADRRYGCLRTAKRGSKEQILLDILKGIDTEYIELSDYERLLEVTGYTPNSLSWKLSVLRKRGYDIPKILLGVKKKAMMY